MHVCDSNFEYFINLKRRRPVLSLFMSVLQISAKQSTQITSRLPYSTYLYFDFHLLFDVHLLCSMTI